MARLTGEPDVQVGKGVKEGKGYNITLTGNDRYKVQEQMEIRQPSKNQSQNLDKGKGR